MRKLQQRLNVLGADPPLEVTGRFTDETNEAVLAFQRQSFADDANEWDGIVGPHTWGKIDTDYRPPEIDATEEAAGAHVVGAIDQLNNQASGPDAGVWYSYNYRGAYPERYKDDYAAGYADPSLFTRERALAWRVKPRTSAAAALQSWMRGLTIAECYTALVASEFDALRGMIGDEKFDQAFGSTDRNVPKHQRMFIAAGGSQVVNYFAKTEGAESGDDGTAGNRPAKPGEWYYFMNHPCYLLKHPGGAWQGENSIYMGREGTDKKQMWAGLGTSGGTGPGGPTHVTEDQMLAEMVEAYNLDRDEDDERALAAAKAANGGVLDPQLDPANKAFPEKLSGPDDILNAEPRSLQVNGGPNDSFVRHGGFVRGYGIRLDIEKVQALRD